MGELLTGWTLYWRSWEEETEECQMALVWVHFQSVWFVACGSSSDSWSSWGVIGGQWGKGGKTQIFGKSNLQKSSTRSEHSLVLGLEDLLIFKKLNNFHCLYLFRKDRKRQKKSTILHSDKSIPLYFVHLNHEFRCNWDPIGSLPFQPLCWKLEASSPT